MTVDEAYALISRAIETGHPARGYLVAGDVEGACADLARKILHTLFPNDAAQVDEGSHPDVVTLDPEGKSRVITVETMRQKIVAPMADTSFSGGWKVGIIRHADRMRQEAANAFLKSLEEPPPKTMYLLLTSRPDAIMPTIVSRTQRVDLPMPDGLLSGDDFDEVADAFGARDAAALAAKLKSLKEDSPDEDAATVRQEFFATIESFARKMMLDGSLPRHLAFRNIEAVEDAFRQSEKSMSDDAVISFMLDRFSWPS